MRTEISRSNAKKNRILDVAESLPHFAPTFTRRPEILRKRLTERPAFGIVSARHALVSGKPQPRVGLDGGGDAAPGTTFVDGGGAVLGNIHIHLVFWGKAWENSPIPSVEDITSAVVAILDGPYMSRLQQYRVAGNGTLIGTTVVNTSDPPQSFSDANVTALVTGLIGTTGFPDFRDDDQLLYCVIMTPGISPANNNFIGEHFGFTFGGGTGQIAWVTNDGTMDFLTTIFSHELVESCTDPQGTGWQGTAGTCNQTGWCEIGDVCTSTDIVGGIQVQSYWSNQDDGCIVPKQIVPGAVAGNPALIQGNLGGGRGNFELVVPTADVGIAHYSRDNNAAFVPWSLPKIFGQTLGQVDGISMIQSNFGFPGNLIVVARAQGSLLGFYRDSGPNYNWSDPMGIEVNGKLISGVSGDPVWTQGRFGPHGNLELVVPLATGGLAHYDCDTNDSTFKWYGPNLFGQNLGRIDSVTMIQSNFGSPGNLEVVVRVGADLLFFWRDSGPSFNWNGPFPILVGGKDITGVAGNPVLIQGRFQKRGNFELIVPLATGGIAHYDRDNDDPNLPWYGPNIFAQDVGNIDAVSLIQSNFGTPGNLELVARFGDELIFFFRDSGPSFHWFGPYQITSGH